MDKQTKASKKKATVAEAKPVIVKTEEVVVVGGTGEVSNLAVEAHAQLVQVTREIGEEFVEAHLGPNATLRRDVVPSFGRISGNTGRAMAQIVLADSDKYTTKGGDRLLIPLDEKDMATMVPKIITAMVALILRDKTQTGLALKEMGFIGHFKPNGLERALPTPSKFHMTQDLADRVQEFCERYPEGLKNPYIETTKQRNQSGESRYFRYKCSVEGCGGGYRQSKAEEAIAKKVGKSPVSVCAHPAQAYRLVLQAGEKQATAEAKAEAVKLADGRDAGDVLVELHEAIKA